jgi:hypothetical protein
MIGEVLSKSELVAFKGWVGDLAVPLPHNPGYMVFRWQGKYRRPFAEIYSSTRHPMALTVTEPGVEDVRDYIKNNPIKPRTYKLKDRLTKPTLEAPGNRKLAGVAKYAERLKRDPGGKDCVGMATVGDCEVRPAFGSVIAFDDGNHVVDISALQPGDAGTLRGLADLFDSVWAVDPHPEIQEVLRRVAGVIEKITNTKEPV